MLQSVFALGTVGGNPPTGRSSRHNITCGLLDILACKDCRRARASAATAKQSPKTTPKKRGERSKVKGKSPQRAWTEQERFGLRNQLNRESDFKKGIPNAKLALSRKQSLSTSNIPDVVNKELSTSGVSILKTSPAFADSRKRLGSDSNLKKQARFSESVSIIIHDHEGHQILKDHIKLKESVKPEPNRTPSPETRCVNPRKQAERPFSVDTMEVEHRGGLPFLRVVIQLGSEFTNDRVEVHTGKLGQSLAIVGYRQEPLGDGTYYMKRYMQKFRLTEQVNPYCIDASLLPSGYVKIKAPLMSAEDGTD